MHYQPRWKICSIGLTRGPSSKKIKGPLRQHTSIDLPRVNPSKGMNSGNTFKQLSLKEIITQQTKTNDEVKQRLDTNESSLKDIHNKMDFLLIAFDEQNTLNKRVELKLIKLAAALPVATNIEQVKNITTRGGKATRDPHTQKRNREHQHQCNQE